MSNETHPVFAYGSNMDLEDLARWMDRRGFGAPRVFDARPAVLPGYRLAWNYHSRARDGGAANVEPLVGQELPGVVLDVDERTFEAIDAKEGHPRIYSRGDEPLSVRLFAGPVTSAWVYVVNPEHRCSTPVWPRRTYLDLLVRGAVRYGLPESHLEWLRSVPVLE